MIRELPWVQDGISGREARGVEGLIDLALYASDVFFELTKEQWVLEAKGRTTMGTIDGLGWLAHREPEALDRIMTHPTFSDGVTDDEVNILAVLHSAQRYTPPLVDVLLDPDRVMLEERNVALPLAGDVELTMIRTQPGVERNMDLLERSVLAIESFMSAPFPASQVIWLFERALHPDASGQNFGSHVVTVPEYYDAEETIKSPFRHFIHEASHHYWSGGSARWITEGAATFLETIIESAATGWPLAMERQPCPSARYIAEDVEGDCDYRFGERLFHDLYRNMDETAFRLAFRQLYFLSQYDDPNDGCDGVDLGICHVRAAFTADVSAATAATVEKVIARWYDGSEPFDTSHQDTSAVDPVIPFMDARVERAWVSLRTGEPVTSVSPAYQKSLDLNIEYSCQGSSCGRMLPFDHRSLLRRGRVQFQSQTLRRRKPQLQPGGPSLAFGKRVER